MRKTLYAYAKDGSYVRSFPDAATAKKVLNVGDVSHIYKVISGKRANAFGYIWSRNRVRNVLEFKLNDTQYVLIDTRTNKVVFRADSFLDMAKLLNCRLWQFKRAVANGGLFRQVFRLGKESKHKM